jgi:flagellar motor switch protein FliG
MSAKAAREKGEKKLGGPQKAAILLITLGDAMSAEVMKHLDEDEVQRIGRELALAQKVPNEVAEAVLDEYYQMSIAHDFVLRGGVDYARKVLLQAFGPDAAKRMLDRMLKTLGGESLSFDTLQKADPQQLAKFIHSEHPQTIALILSHLSPTQAAGLLGSLPVEIRSEVAIRMANLEQISPDIIAKIANIIGFKLRELGEVSRQSMGGVEAVAEMFNRMDTMSSKEMMERIEQADPKLGETIRHLMFVFEDLLVVDGNGIKEVLSRVDRKILTVALKGTSEQLRQNFLAQMSQRGAEMLKEDMEALGPVKIRDVESAQQQIIAVVRQLEAEGVINLSGGGSEQYVE